MASTVYFGKQQGKPVHPRIKHWRVVLARPENQNARVELYRPWDGIMRVPTRLFLKRPDETIIDEVPWEPELEQWLVEQKIPATTEDNEMVRFSLLLGRALRAVTRRYGDGYFDAVLVKHIREGPYAEHPEIVDALFQIAPANPSPDREAECSEQIKEHIIALAESLVEIYSDEHTAESILIGAISGYLDERFRITERKKLGWG